MPGNYIQIGGKKRTVVFSEANVTRDEQGRFAKKGSGGGVSNKGLLTKQERQKLKLSSSMQGASIKAIPGESQKAQSKRARKAAQKFRKQTKKGLK